MRLKEKLSRILQKNLKQKTRAIMITIKNGKLITLTTQNNQNAEIQDRKITITSRITTIMIIIWESRITTVSRKWKTTVVTYKD